MLAELNIKNIALIESLRIEFTRGLNVLTGETGTGKSIVVDCVNLALGQRGGRELVRTGEEKGSVRALFDIGESKAARAFLEGMQLEYDDGYVEVSRELTSSGRGICRINGCVVPLGTLREFTSLIVDLHGQQEHQRLLDASYHLAYLDSFGDKDIAPLKTEMQAAYTQYSQARRALDKLNEDEKNLSQRFDILTMQSKEISAAKLKIGEEEELDRKNRLYENAEKLSDNMRTAYERVYLGSGKSLSAQDSLKKAADALGSVSDVDETCALLAERLESLLCEVKDIGYEIQSIYEELSFDPAEKERVQDRLEEIKRLKRKYGPELADVLEFGKRAAQELETLKNIDSRREELEEEYNAAEKVLRAAAARLTEKRREYARLLEGEIMEQLKQLGMERTQLKCEFEPRREIAPGGAEDVQFMISPNPGEPLRPLTAIASGGEISRFMLALKVILAKNDGIGTMIFDEIDTGISGRMAETVGEKMSVLAAERQVIAVTHLAQIAALADTQFRVEKTVTDGRTGSHVAQLDHAGRISELARLVGGAGGEDSGLKHAESMLTSAEAKKRELRAALKE